MFYNNQKVLGISLVFALYAGLVFAQEAPFISKSLSEDTVIGPNGAVTVADALAVSQLMGAEKKVAHEITKGVYHIRGWGIAHTIAIDAPEGWIIVDTGDSNKTAKEMRDRLEKKVGKKNKGSSHLVYPQSLHRWH